MAIVDRLAGLISSFREPEELRVERNRFEKASRKTSTTGVEREVVVGGEVYVLQDPKPNSAGVVATPKDSTA